MSVRLSKSKRYGIIIVVVLIAIGGVVYVKHTHSLTPARGVDTKVHAGPAHDTPPTTSSGSTATATMQSNPSHPITSLAAPIGPDDNIQTVSLSGATGMESVCRSVPGAACYIQASKDGQTITVSDSETVGDNSDSDGVILDWNANKLSVGTWNIQAVASKDGQKAISGAETLKVTS